VLLLSGTPALGRHGITFRMGSTVPKGHADLNVLVGFVTVILITNGAKAEHKRW
jgi:hypothetical protein